MEYEFVPWTPRPEKKTHLGVLDPVVEQEGHLRHHLRDDGRRRHGLVIVKGRGDGLCSALPNGRTRVDVERRSGCRGSQEGFDSVVSVVALDPPVFRMFLEIRNRER